MASVYHLFIKSENLNTYLTIENRNLEGPGKKRYYAALLIQRVYRGYRVRKMVKFWHQQATIIQRWVRGWLVRWHLPETYQEYFIRLTQSYYDKMATKIQALWRGYLVRKNMPMSMAELARLKKLMEESNARITGTMRGLFARMNEKGLGALDEDQRRKLGDECRQWVLYILFKTHHLVRTEVIEGIYSEHGQNKKSQIEEWMSKLPMKKYMDDLRKIYNKEFANTEKPIHYLFESRAYREMEDCFRLRDRSHELKPVPYKLESNLHKKPFDTTNRPVRYPYFPPQARQNPYGVQVSLLRQFEKFSQESDFDLFVHKFKEPQRSPPPYYIDTWMKKCSLHYPDDD
ncbi:spermatogenesis-associated protein 17-like [Onthophagus taurus]|uniref:spermatogenesis-associated protein 17-like n=1 Tax=Onthophagus taurus TaxID=166361 RepID=UPI0039BE4421